MSSGVSAFRNRQIRTAHFGFGCLGERAREKPAIGLIAGFWERQIPLTIIEFQEWVHFTDSRMPITAVMTLANTVLHQIMI